MKVICATFVFAVCAAAYAEPTKEDKARAKALFESGEKHFRLGEFDKATDDWRASYDALPEPLLLYNLGQAYRARENYSQAIFFYKGYLASSVPTSDQRHSVEERLTQLQKALEEHKKAQEAPPTGPSQVPTVQPAPPAPVIAAAHPAPPPRPWAQRNAIALGLGAAGLALVGTGGGLLGAAASEGSQASASTTQPGYAQHHATDLTYQQAGWPLLGIGIGAAVTGAIVLVVKGARK